MHKEITLKEWNNICLKIENLISGGVTVFFDGIKIMRVFNELTSPSKSLELVNSYQYVDHLYVTRNYPYPHRIIKGKFTRISYVYMGANKIVAGGGR